MFHDKKGAGQDAGDDFAAGEDTAKDQGDGMHHHEIHEDEGGGFHSKHTHPDGRVEHDDHATYEEARDKMDEHFGHGEPDGDEGEAEGGDIDPEDIGGSYGRAGRD